MPEAQTDHIAQGLSPVAAVDDAHFLDVRRGVTEVMLETALRILHCQAVKVDFRRFPAFLHMHCLPPLLRRTGRSFSIIIAGLCADCKSRAKAVDAAYAAVV